jgi:acetylornithine/N-succinyldiaminopimelate aminotransferase
MITPVLPVYKRNDIMFERGQGCNLYTAEGKRYLDFAVGIAVCAFGHTHPRLIKALTEQANRVWIVSNMFHVPGQLRVAEKLKKISFADTVFFTNSGVEAWECGVKIIRRHFWAKGQADKNRIIVCKGLFHGRTIAAISAAKTPKMCDGFGPLVDGFDQVPFNDIQALEAAITPQTAAIHFETVQGEGGITPASAEYLRKARELCDKHGMLLFLDEIQCGMGRTGKIWAYEHVGVKPDVMCIAKGFGGGFPVGACLATEHAASGMTIGSHGTTYGGNPLGMAVAEEVLNMIVEPGVLEHVNKVAAYADHKLRQLMQEFPSLIIDVRGKGLMMGLQLSEEYADMHRLLLKEGLISVGAGKDVIRFVPPLIVTEAEIDEAIELTRRACKARLAEQAKNTAA